MGLQLSEEEEPGKGEIKAVVVLVTRKDTVGRKRTRLRSGRWEMREEGDLGQEATEEQFRRECGLSRRNRAFRKVKAASSVQGCGLGA